ncbi:MAG: hypothetical protein PHX09_03475, partial [Clostridia bacterium]|nr:hypothetical protein [Clostridia bacterium]
ILLFVSIIISVIRSEYASDKIEPKSAIVMKSFKSVIFMAIVPIAVLFGVYLSNVVLQAVDKATSISTNSSFKFLDTSKLKSSETASGATTYIYFNMFMLPEPTTTTTFSGVVFNASAYGANRVRLTENVQLDTDAFGQGGYNGFLGLLNAGKATNFDGLLVGDEAAQVAGAIDEAFANFVQVNNPANLDYFSSDHIRDQNITAVDPFTILTQANCTSFDRFNVSMIWYYYNLWFYNFLIAFAAGIILSVMFINLSMGLMGRFVELIALLLVAAPLISIMPLDGGNAYNAWRGKFIGKALMVIGAVGGMNIVFLILPYLNELSFFPHVPLVDYIISILFMIVALNLVKGLVAMFSSFIKSEDLNESGGKIAKEAGAQAAKAGMMLAGAGGLALKGAALLPKIGGGALKTYAANTVKGRAAQAAKYNAERVSLKKAFKEQEDVSKLAEEEVRYSGIYKNMSDADFVNERRTNRTDYERALNTRKEEMAEEYAQSMPQWQMQTKDETHIGKKSYKSAMREEFSSGVGDIFKATGENIKTMLDPIISSPLSKGWSDEKGSAAKMLVKLNIPYISPAVKKETDKAELEKEVKEALKKQKALEEAERRRLEKS